MRAGLLVLAACGAAQRPVPAQTGLDEVARRAFASSHLAGISVAVLRHGEPVLVAGYGLADVAQQVPATPQTRFYWIGAGLPVLGALTMLAVERGTLHLDEDIGARWPQLAGITVRELADTTSGLADFHYLGDRYEQLVAMRRSGDEVTAAFASLPLRHAPGASSEWTVSGLHLLGMLVERASGAPLREVSRREVFEPAGVARDVDLCDGSFLPPHLAPDQAETPGGFMGKLSRHPSTWAYTGAAYCGTALAAARTARALRSGRVLSRELFAHMIEAQPAAPDNGIAVFLGNLEGHRWWGGQGSTIGHASALLDFPADDLTIVVLASSGGRAIPIAEALARAVLGLPAGRAAEPDPAPPRTEPATDRGLIGVYTFSFTKGHPPHAVMHYSVRITELGGALYWQRCGELPKPLLRASDGTYFVGDALDEPLHFTAASVEHTQEDELYSGARAADDAFCAAR